jgi:hypothetical protein
LRARPRAPAHVIHLRKLLGRKHHPCDKTWRRLPSLFLKTDFDSPLCQRSQSGDRLRSIAENNISLTLQQSELRRSMPRMDATLKLEMRVCPNWVFDGASNNVRDRNRAEMDLGKRFGLDFHGQNKGKFRLIKGGRASSVRSRFDRSAHRKSDVKMRLSEVHRSTGARSY